MKKALLALATVAMAASTFAQGTIDFMNRNIPGANGGASYNVPIWQPNSTTAGGGTMTGGVTVGLFESAASTTPLVTTLLRTDANAQFFATSTQTATTSLPPGSTPTLVVRAWQTAAGSFATAKSSGTFAWAEIPFTSQPLGGTPPGGGLPIPTPGMTGWGPGPAAGGYQLQVPEPSTFALGALGIGALGLLRRRK
jgi:hypothetical protein